MMLTTLTLTIVSLVLVFAFTCLGILHFFSEIPSLKRYLLIRKIPGPRGFFLVGNAIELMKLSHEDMLPWITNHVNNYGKIMRLWLFGFSFVFITDPDYIQCVLNSTQHINKGLEYRIFWPWLKTGLLTSTGEKWFTRRKLLTPAFHFKILEDNMAIFNKTSKILRDNLMLNLNKDLLQDNFICNCTLDSIVQAAMGINLDIEKPEGQRYFKETKTISEIFAYRMSNPHLFNDFLFFNSPKGKRFKEAVRYLRDFTTNVIEERKKKMVADGVSGKVSSSGKIRRAFLDLMLEHEMKYPGSFSDKGIREEVDTFTFEGHDTTSVTLNYIFYNLAKYQDIQEKVYAELYGIFGNDDRDTTVNDLHQMVYMEQFIKENLRLYSSVPGIARFLKEDMVLNDGTILPARTNVVLPLFLIHQNPQYWPDPQKFDPERFSEDQIKGRHPYSYVPFSAGPRNCIGQKFVMMELKTVTANIIRKLKVLPVTKNVKTTMSITLRTVKPILVKFIARE